jgi:hypothetical protein
MLILINTTKGAFMSSINNLLDANHWLQRERNRADAQPSMPDRIAAHIKIAQDDPQHDFSWAKRCALIHSGSGFNLIMQRSNIRTIAKAEACFNVAAAIATADSIVDDTIERELAYIDIIRSGDHIDIKTANRLVRAIKEPLRQDYARKHIAVKLAKSGYISAGEEAAALIKEDFHREQAFSAINALKANNQTQLG